VFALVKFSQAGLICELLGGRQAPEASLLSIRSNLAPALGVTKFTKSIVLKSSYCMSKAVFTLTKVSAITPAIMPATATLIALALATLDDATQIGSFLLAKVSK
jgi:hypothetical protein